MLPKTTKHFDPTANIPEKVEQVSASDHDSNSVDLNELLSSFSIPERRCIYALRYLCDETKKLQRRLQEEIAVLEVQKRKDFSSVMDIRRAVVLGHRDIAEEEVKSLPPFLTEEEAIEQGKKKKTVQSMSPWDAKEKTALEEAAKVPHGGIPNFWLTCFLHSDTVSMLVEEQDRPILSYLQDITVEHIDGNPLKGNQLFFTFESNPYFNSMKGPLTLTIQTEMDDHEGEPMVSHLEGCTIPWLSDEMNPTVTMEKRKQRNTKTKEMRVVTRKVPRDSFFNIFTVEQNRENVEEDEELEKLEMYIMAALEIAEDILPNAAKYYGWLHSGALSALEGEDGMDEEEDVEEEEEEEEGEEEEEEEEAEEEQKGKKHGGNGKGQGTGKTGQKGSKGKPAGGKTEPECKQQ